jgi:hypothetical protein
MSVRTHFAALVRLLICAAFMHSHIRVRGAARRGVPPEFLRRHMHQDAGHDNGWKVVVSRLAAVLLLAAVALGFVAPAASAVPKKKLDDYLAAMWTTVLRHLVPKTRSAAAVWRSPASTLAATRSRPSRPSPPVSNRAL